MLLNADFLRLKMRSQKVVLTNGGSLGLNSSSKSIELYDLPSLLKKVDYTLDEILEKDPLNLLDVDIEKVETKTLDEAISCVSDKTTKQKLK